MNNFISLAIPVFIAFVIVLPVLLIGAGALVTTSFVRSVPQMRRVGLQIAVAAGGFLLFDGLLLKALPWLGLSYGPITFTLVVLTVVRAVLFILFASLFIRLSSTGSRRVYLLPFCLLNGLLTLLVVYAFYNEPFNLRVTRIEVPVPASALSSPMRIVHLTDLHMERPTRREQKLLSAVRELKPDLIALTGDYLNISYLDDPAAIQHARNLLDQLFAPYGVYAVNGSVDNEARMQAIFGGTQIQVLKGEVVQVPAPGSRVYLVGVPDTGDVKSGDILRDLAIGMPADGIQILLHHTPDLAFTASETGMDLYLAGHTHGGQICVPLYGALVTASIYGKTFESGLYHVGDTRLYVNRGLGMEGGPAPRARFFAPPEVLVIDLVPSPD